MGTCGYLFKFEYSSYKRAKNLIIVKPNKLNRISKSKSFVGQGFKIKLFFYIKKIFFLHRVTILTRPIFKQILTFSYLFV